MGSHLWSVLAPFGDDPPQVLREVRLRAFREGAYGKPWARGQPKAESIDELIRKCAEDGTCSVIDVVEVCEEPGPGVAGRIPSDVLERLLGTSRPTRAEAEKNLHPLGETLNRGEAAFVVCYENGEPDAVLFFGWSFD